MTNFKIRVNPTTKEVDYMIEGNYSDLLSVDMNKINEMNKIVKKISETFDTLSTNDYADLVSTRPHNKSASDKSNIDVPSNLISIVENLDDRLKIPILWSFSSKPAMSVGEFLTTSAAQGFSISSSWHPSSGGQFATKLVNADKMFHTVKSEGKEKIWELTTVGKLKIANELKKLKKSINN